MLRRIVGWIVLVPLCLVLIIFALANRQLTVVNFNPFISPDALAAPAVGMPLFLVIFGVLLVGVVLGGIASWFAAGQIRRDRRKWQREAERLSRELEGQRKAAGRKTGQHVSAENLLEVDDLVDSN
jgi:uncharacterized integral membrane protein